MSSVVETTRGRVEGHQEEGIPVFRGIPYAEPPVGALRFQPPRAKKPWAGVLAAHAYRDYCPQAYDPVQVEFWALSGNASEDCLSLNVWTPGLDGARRPVLVWIHGGAFSVGAARRPATEGGALARRADAVVVTLNYRLHALGWLDLFEMGSDYARSGNHGLLDQIAALEWVRDNVVEFGGDPDNVTVFGESAGGISLSVLLTTPLARGLFHRAIVQSGTANLVRTREQARAIARAVLRAAKADDAAALRRVEVEELLRIIAEDLTGFEADLMFGSVADGDVLPLDPLAATSDGPMSDVPLLHGTNLDEFRYWYMEDPRLVDLRPEHVQGRIERETGRAAKLVLDAYRESRPDLSDNQLAVALVGEMAFRMPHIRMSELRANAGRKSWMYLFTFQSPVQEGRLGASHAMDIPFVFGNLDAPNVSKLIGDAPERQRLSRAMQDAWIAFARTGDPNHAELPRWDPYDLERRPTLLFDLESRAVDDPLRAEREAWGDAPFRGIPL
jgi:para-nitrobenzyl esterase